MMFQKALQNLKVMEFVEIEHKNQYVLYLHVQKQKIYTTSWTAINENNPIFLLILMVILWRK